MYVTLDLNNSLRSCNSVILSLHELVVCNHFSLLCVHCHGSNRLQYCHQVLCTVWMHTCCIYTHMHWWTFWWLIVGSWLSSAAWPLMHTVYKRKTCFNEWPLSCVPTYCSASSVLRPELGSFAGGWGGGQGAGVLPPSRIGRLLLLLLFSTQKSVALKQARVLYF